MKHHFQLLIFTMLLSIVSYGQAIDRAMLGEVDQSKNSLSEMKSEIAVEVVEAFQDPSTLLYSSYEIVSVDEYKRLYSTFPWMHIGRLKALNREHSLEDIDRNTDFSTIKFTHTSNFAYLLYSGNYLICKVSNKKK